LVPATICLTQFEERVATFEERVATFEERVATFEERAEIFVFATPSLLERLNVLESNSTNESLMVSRESPIHWSSEIGILLSAIF
jgi:hypothetical protein